MRGVSWDPTTLPGGPKPRPKPPKQAVKLPGKPKPPPPGGTLGPVTGIPPWTRVYPPGTIQNSLLGKNARPFKPLLRLGEHPVTETHVALQEPRFGFYDGDKAGQQTERALILQQLVEHPGWALLVEMVQAAAKPYEDILVSGRAHDYAEYRERAGYLRALRYVLTLPTTEQNLARDMERAAAQRRTDDDS